MTTVPFRQAVIQVGSTTIKAGLWEQTFLPTLIIPAQIRPEHDTSPISTDDKTIRPVMEGRLVDVDALKALIQRILETDLGLGSSLRDVTLLLIIPGEWNRTIRKTLLRKILGELSLGGMWLGESAVMAAFGCACATAVVIDLGATVTEVAIVTEGEFQPSLAVTLPIGGEIIDKHMAKAMDMDVEWARSLREDPASQENTEEEFTFRGRPVSATALQHMFDPFFTEDAGIVEAVGELLQKCDVEHRPQAWDHVILTGGVSRHPRLASELRHHLAERLLTVSGNAGDRQLRAKSAIAGAGLSGNIGINLRTVPTFYPDIWREATPVAAWFGGGITAKCVLGDPKAIYTLEDWQQHGDNTIRNKVL